MEEAPKHPHNIAQNTFTRNKSGKYFPNPAPVLSRTPGISKALERAPNFGEHTQEILLELGYSSDLIEKLKDQGVVEAFLSSKL